MEKLMASNALEHVLVEAQSGRKSMDEFLRVLVSSHLFIASVEEIQPGVPGLSPLLFDRNGVPMAAVFTDSSRATVFAGRVKSLVRKNACDLLRHIPDGYGVVINPGFDVGLELLPDGIRGFLKRFCMPSL